MGLVPWGLCCRALACLQNALLTPLSRLVFVDWRRLMGLTASHCDLHCVVLMGPCAINDPWCSEVLLKLNRVCKVKRSSWFPPDWIRCWRYDLLHPRWRSGVIIFLKSFTWPKTPFCQSAQFCTREAHYERVSFQTCKSPQWDIFARRCDVDVAVPMKLVSMQTPNNEDCCAIDIRALSDNLYNPSKSIRWWRRCPFGPVCLLAPRKLFSAVALSLQFWRLAPCQ